MVFERALKWPIANWNISGEKFLFQESRKSKAIYIVKLYIDKTPKLFKFNLPVMMSRRDQFSYYSPELDKIVIPEDASFEGSQGGMQEEKQAPLRKIDTRMIRDHKKIAADAEAIRDLGEGNDDIDGGINTD